MLAVAALTLAAVVGGQDWSWSLFGFGVVVALLVAAVWVAPYWVIVRRGSAGLSPERRLWAKRRIVFYGIGMAFVGVDVALLAAMFDAAWVLVVYVCLVVVLWVLSLLLMVWIRRRLLRRRQGREPS